MPVKIKIKVLNAEYVKEADSIAILGECSDGKLTNQIHKSCFSFGSGTEAEIDCEMEKTAKMLVGKEIFMVFDEDLIKKMENNESIKY